MIRHTTTTPVGARRRLIVQLAGLSVVASLALSDHARAAEYLTGVAGGSTGSPFAIRCAEDEVLAGVTGKAGWYIDKIQALCVQVDPLGRWIGIDVAGGSAGGTLGSPFTLRCAENHAVSGIKGRAGSFIDQLRIRCGPLTAGPRLASSGSFLEGKGG